MVDVDPNSKLYVVRFKEKEKRQNKKDDKMEILRQAIGLRDTNNILDLVRESQRTKFSENKDNPNLAKDHQTVVDINLYEIPSVHIKLSTDQAAALRRHPDVRWVYEPGMSYTCAEVVPWHITRVQSNSLNPQTRHTGYGVKVAVIDTGINYNHQDLKPNYKGGVSFVPGLTDPMDDNNATEMNFEGQTVAVYHGTHCSSCVAAAINNADMVGVAPQAFLYAGKVFGHNQGSPNAVIAQAIVWADQNDMDVISMSLGSTGNDPDEADAIAKAYANGRFIAAAAGNDGKQEIFYPAGYAGTWSVGAVDQADTLASFSNWGSPTDFVAPGKNITGCNGGATSGTHILDGTSQATPHIAGLAAIAYANYRFSPCDTNVYPPAQTKLVHIAGAMIASCDTLGQTSPGVRSAQYGFGMPQALAMTELLTGVTN
jgi:subtilisin